MSKNGLMEEDWKRNIEKQINDESRLRKKQKKDIEKDMNALKNEIKSKNSVEVEDNTKKYISMLEKRIEELEMNQEKMIKMIENCKKGAPRIKYCFYKMIKYMNSESLNHELYEIISNNTLAYIISYGIHVMIQKMCIDKGYISPFIVDAKSNQIKILVMKTNTSIQAVLFNEHVHQDKDAHWVPLNESAGFVLIHKVIDIIRDRFFSDMNMEDENDRFRNDDYLERWNYMKKLTSKKVDSDLLMNVQKNFADLSRMKL